MCVSLCVFDGLTQKKRTQRGKQTFGDLFKCWHKMWLRSRGRELTSLLWTWDRDWTLDSGGMRGVQGARGGHVGKGINSQGWRDKKTNIDGGGDDILF